MPFSRLLPLSLGALAPIAYLVGTSGASGPVVAEMRNFYGVVRVTMGLDIDGRGEKLIMTHGRTTHGTEYIHEKANPKPSTYYTARSGVGLAINEHRATSPLEGADGNPNGSSSPDPVRAMDVGVIGLGTGTLASYAKPRDHWRFYEINPDVIRLAREPFTYLRSAAAPIQIVEGDGRLGLTKDSDAKFDILVVEIEGRRNPGNPYFKSHARSRAGGPRDGRIERLRSPSH
jgi:hypothetical protein